MEIINIESHVFAEMAARFEQFTKRIETLCNRKGKNMQKWLDNQDICQILNISKRTLQTYRDNGTLPYSQIGHKMYYKTEDVERVLNQLKNKPYGK
jgi:FixJ family two-component response regulator